MQTFSSGLSKTQQAVTYTELGTLGAHKVRISIKSDAYEEQCYARIERFDGHRWQSVHTIAPSNMITRTKLVYSRNVSEGDFAHDREALISSAAFILGVSQDAE